MFKLLQPITRKELILLNDCYFQLKPSNGYIEIVQINGRYQKNTNIYTFFAKDTKEIKIGRDKSCQVNLNWDKTYSKVQCSLLWDEMCEVWNLIDGSKEKGGSRNGTWVFASKSCELSNGMNFRIVNSKLSVNIYQP